MRLLKTQKRAIKEREKQRIRQLRSQQALIEKKNAKKKKRAKAEAAPKTCQDTLHYKYMFENTENIKQITCLAETGLYNASPTSGSETHGLTFFVVFNNTSGHIVPNNVVFIKSPNTGYSEIGSNTDWRYNRDAASGTTYCSGILTPWTIIDYEEP
jgi:hypothetical protein